MCCVPFVVQSPTGYHRTNGKYIHSSWQQPINMNMMMRLVVSVHQCIERSLTHWGQVTHICVSQAYHHWFRWWLVAWPAPSHYLNQCWNIVNWTLGNKVQWKCDRNSYIFIQENALENVVWEMASILSRPQCLKVMAWLLFSTKLNTAYCLGSSEAVLYKIYRIMHGLPWITILGHEWSDLSIIFTSDEVMSEKSSAHRISSDKNIVIHGNKCIILFLTQCLCSDHIFPLKNHRSLISPFSSLI